MRLARTFLFLCLSLCLFDGAMASEAEALVEEGNRLWQQGQLDRAFARYEAAGKADPESVDARMKSAGVLYAKQAYREGVQRFQQAISIDPQNANAYIGMAIGYLHMGQDGPAYAALEEAVRLDPGKYDRVQPLMARIEARVPHFTPRANMSDEDIERHVEGMR